MSLSKYSEIKEDTDFDQEILSLQKLLFQYKMEKITNQKFSSHLFRHTKRRLAQLKSKKTALKFSSSNLNSLRVESKKI